MHGLNRWKWTAQVAVISVGLALNAVQTVLAEVVPITLLHLNDIYEITPVEGGQRGGLARVATLRKQLLAKNPHTFTILAGDAFSPSALGTAKVNGERLAGKQMVAVMNAVGFNYATFGNHEFDISQNDFLQRLQESKFEWISSNVSDAAGHPFPGVMRDRILTIRSQQGKPVRIGLFGVTLDSNPQDYVRYEDVLKTAREQVAKLRNQVDILVAITHLSLQQDQQLAATFPGIDLILGGHEHENIQQWRIVDRPQKQSCLDSGVPIFKADANARTVYILDLNYDTDTRCLTIKSHLQPITPAIAEDPATAQVVKNWVQLGYQGFREQGFDPEQTVATISESLDGLESSVRNQPTNLTQLIAQAMLREVGNADLAIFNGGSIRIDDRLPVGAITQYDIIRVLPFGGKVLSVQIPGELLQRVLQQGQANRGAGGFLQTANVTRSASGEWFIQGQPLQLQRTYTVAINDFLMTGKEQGLNFLNFNAPGVVKLAEKRDIRFAVIQELQSKR
jgi:5'-nucleotidase